MIKTRTATDINEEARRRLEDGEGAESIANDLGLVVVGPADAEDYDGDELVLALRGLAVEDREACDVEYSEWPQDDAWGCAEAYVDSWHDGENTATEYWDIEVVRRGLVRDDGGDVISLIISRTTETVTVHPAEPECEAEDWDPETGETLTRDDGHEWRDSGLQGHGGGVVYDETCEHCGLIRETDTWATNPETGEQGLESVSYSSGEDL
jgi:hypothetical protein